MSVYNITIDGFIGPWGYSKQWLSEMLKGHEKDQVNLTLSSLGGSVDHALNMHEQLKRHGNVNVTLSGFNASSSTIVAMGAKTRQISKYGFFLVHKVMSWVDAFGYMNEDDIEALIERLDKEKNENAKMTLVLAQIYSDELGKPVKDLLALMKQDTWLGAEEAKEWGFVDDIYMPSSEEKAAMYDLAKVAMINANGLPVPSLPSQKDNRKDTDPNETLFHKIVNYFNENFKTKPRSMDRQFLNINQAIGVDQLEASDEGVYLNEEQLTVIDEQVAMVQSLTNERDTLNQQLSDLTAERDALSSERDTLNEQAATLTAERDAATQAQTMVTELLNAIDDSVATAETIEDKVAAIRTIIARKPGSKPAGRLATQDPGTPADGVDWETLNSLSHMQEE